MPSQCVVSVSVGRQGEYPSSRQSPPAPPNTINTTTTTTITTTITITTPISHNIPNAFLPRQKPYGTQTHHLLFDFQTKCILAAGSNLSRNRLIWV